MLRYIIHVSVFALFCMSCGNATDVEDNTDNADTSSDTQPVTDTATGTQPSDTGNDGGTETESIIGTDSTTTSDPGTESGTDAEADTESESASDTGGVACTDDVSRCNGLMLERCVNGRWQPWDDCSVYGQRCTVLEGVFQCAGHIAVDTNDTGTDAATDSSDTTPEGDTATHRDTSDTDSATDATDTEDVDTNDTSCDGEDVDCYTECWGCGLTSLTCQPALEACLTDNRCAAFYQCRIDACCDGGRDCLTGEEWEECIADCKDSVEATADTLDLYRNIDKCIACDACAISCGENESLDFAMCASADKVNSEGNPCYTEDAEAGEVACFGWAGWGGPCTAAADACRNDRDCDALDRCINSSWSEPNWASIQEQCYYDAGTAAESRYWAWMQCIYCDACSVACAMDAGSKRCDEYEGK